MYTFTNLGNCAGPVRSGPNSKNIFRRTDNRLSLSMAMKRLCYVIVLGFGTTQPYRLYCIVSSKKVLQMHILHEVAVGLFQVAVYWSSDEPSIPCSNVAPV